jgi:hypothetical protein
MLTIAWPRRAIAALAVAGALAVVPAAHATTRIPYYPTGYVDNYQGSIYYPGDVPTITGWAADANAPHSPIYVRVDIDWTHRLCHVLGCITLVVGQSSNLVYANQFRADLVGVTGPGNVPWGAHHGFSLTPSPPVPLGSFDGGRACVTAINVGAGADRSLGCYPLVFAPLV